MKNAIIGAIATLIVTGILSNISMAIEQGRIRTDLDNYKQFNREILENQKEIIERLTEDNIQNKIDIAILKRER